MKAEANVGASVPLVLDAEIPFGDGRPRLSGGA
jgi:hypothetical protein